jgi:hypothetical protein
MMTATTATTAEQIWATALSDYETAAAALTAAYLQEDADHAIDPKLESDFEARRDNLLSTPAPHVRAAMQKLWTLCEDEIQSGVEQETYYNLIKDLDRLDPAGNHTLPGHKRPWNFGLVEHSEYVAEVEAERKARGIVLKPR